MKNKFIETFFFGYLSFKYRRLIRTPIILIVIIPLGLGTLIGLNRPFPDKKLIRTLYNEYPLYITPSNKYFSIREVEIDNSDSLEYYLEEGILTPLEVSYDEFYELLWTDEKLLETVGRNYYRFEMEQNVPNHYSYFKEYELNLIQPSVRFKSLIEFSFFSSIILFFVFLISFLVEPFVKKVEKKDEPNEEVKNEKEITTISENEIKSSEIVSQVKSDNKSGFKNYFSFNSEYLSGSSYLLRMIIGGITVPLFFLGLFLISPTVYKRSISLGFSKTVSIINCVLIPILFSLSVVIKNTQITFGDSDDPLMTIVPFLFLIPHLFLIFKNGKNSLKKL
jgi:hypothetical protein